MTKFDPSATKMFLLVATTLSIVPLLSMYLIFGQRTVDPSYVENPVYCEMVQHHKDTGGEVGWTDFKKTFNQYCM